MLGTFPEVQTDSIHIICWFSLALSFQAGFLVLCLWSLLLVLRELALLLLASLWVLLELFPACCRGGLTDHPSHDIRFHDVNVWGSYYYYFRPSLCGDVAWVPLSSLQGRTQAWWLRWQALAQGVGQ